MRIKQFFKLALAIAFFSLVGLFCSARVIQAAPTPTGFTATSVEDSTGLYVLLSWHHPSSYCSSPGTPHYEIYRGSSSGEEVFLADYMDMDSASYKDYNVNKGSTYYYRINIVDCEGTSPLTNEVSVTVGMPLAYPGSTLGIDAGAQMEWKYFNVNQTAIQALATEPYSEYTAFSDLQEDYRIHLNVNAIREYDASWHVDVDVKGGINLDHDLNTWDTGDIYKSPMEFTGIGASAFFSTDWRVYEFFVIPANVAEYLKGLQASLTPARNVQAIGRTIIINGTSSLGQIIITLSYNEQGLVENATLACQGNILAQLKLISYIGGIPTALVFSCIVIASLAYCGYLCVHQWVVWREGRLQFEAIEERALAIPLENSTTDVLAHSEKKTGSIALLLAWGGLTVFLFFTYRADFPRLISFMNFWDLIAFYGTIFFPLLAIFRHTWFFKRIFWVTRELIYFNLPHMLAATIHWGDIKTIEVQEFIPDRKQTIKWFTTQFKFAGPEYSRLVVFHRGNGFPKEMSEKIKQILIRWSRQFGVDFVDRSHASLVDTRPQNN